MDKTILNRILIAINVLFTDQEAKKKRRRTEEVVAKNSFKMFTLEWN